MKITTIFCSIFFAAFVAVSCSTSTNTAKIKPRTDVSISNQNWCLVTDSEVVKGLYNKEVSLVINETNSTVSGFSGCNNFNATLSKSNGVISFTNISETKMACPNLKEEQAFLSMLKNVNRYEVGGKELHLYKDNILLLTFKTT
ncbi:META domain-containing protein [Chishuiella sp.]|uniref:META domain-containing protein n=1 Tax=Chishuiella sp. TaxID=1969467 RepID=UPI0028AB7541|nr:META domain-containing protein [Chishuiella sp.]